MKKNLNPVTLGALALAALAVALSAAPAQDEVLMSMAMSDSPMVITRGTGDLLNGSADVTLPRTFCKQIDADRGIQCFVTGDDGRSLSMSVSLVTEQIRVTDESKAAGKFHWVAIGTPKGFGNNHR